MDELNGNSRSNFMTGSSAGPRDVLVTGATGFVGGELLKRLLGQFAHARIVCPVRADSAEHATQRGRQRLEELLGVTEATRKAPDVEWIRSDLEHERLGWDSHTWRRVATSIAEIYHCAAAITFDLPLADAERINVQGTVHIHELAESAQAIHGQFRRFHHVSTAYVAGCAAPRNVEANYLPADKASLYRNTYERTKARAERYLRKKAVTVAHDAVPVSIYRPSIVVGDTVHGATTSWNVLYIPMKLQARGMLPVFPRSGRALLDTVGVDFVVDAMLALADQATGPIESFHLTAGPAVPTVDDLFDQTWAKATAHPRFTPSSTRLLGPAEWGAFVNSMRLAAKAPKRFKGLRRTGVNASRGLSSVNVYVPYTQVDTHFRARREHELLARYGVTMPDGPTFLDTVIDYALATDFGKRAAPMVTLEPEAVPA